ncbi:hypothetical protein [Lysobacter silvisoli]|uniref:Uncharacterized protein n=1 Tax=Lysobacter silvisoli TaxID=2293254 RepID=A0A371K4D2_9GAMM|nr:hypothetical protein [Lysobacter silvisoli]RDZ28730.1 hypothetical protein DX914_06300 [Lysobacter silvisoli]
MNEYRHHVLTRGRYQIVALTPDERYEDDDIYAYAVMSSSGVKLRQELTLSDARNWLEDRIERERPQQERSPRAREPSSEAAPVLSSLLRPGRKKR